LFVFVYIIIATDILYGRKERNARSLDRDYVGDYCNLHQRPDLQRLIPRNEKTDFSSYLYKYDRRFRRQGRYFISTNQALYIIDEECVCLIIFLQKKKRIGFIFHRLKLVVEKEVVQLLTKVNNKKVICWNIKLNDVFH
jgi:hypothetical protein